mgnify:CR=1 FL=1
MLLYSYDSENMEKEKAEFIRLLYHDRRGGVMIRLKKDEKDVQSFSTCSEQELAATGTDDAHIYTSVNTFRGAKRSSDKLYCYCSIYIDLDCHAGSMAEVAAAKQKTAKILEEAYNSGTLAVPTMITDTGRGYGIQYVLKSSIANGKNEAQRNFFKRVREGIFLKYKALMETDAEAATADATVLDDSRVCRMPGTYNTNAGAYCRLIAAEERYYELSELVIGCHLWEWRKKEDYLQKKDAREVEKKKRKIIPFRGNFAPFLRNRIEQLKMLQKIRGDKCTDSCREQMLFIAYSALKQVDRHTAVEKLQEMNAEFTKPLNQKEVEHIIAETDADEKGFYKLPDEYVVRTLSLTEEEIVKLGFGNGWRRTAAKRENAKKKNAVREKIILLLKQEKRLTYEEIANRAGVSRRKVCMVAKEEGLTRYQKRAKGCLPEIEDAESAKKCIESVCVTSDVDVLCGGLASLSVSSLVTSSFTRLIRDCLGVPSLTETVLSFVRRCISSYAGLSQSSLLEQQLSDLRTLALFYVDFGRT